MNILNNPALLILAINSTLIIGCYLWYFPCFVRDNVPKLLLVDSICSIGSIVIAGVLFIGKDIEFSLLSWEMNWFWFALVTYFLIETPFSLVYSLLFLRNKH